METIGVDKPELNEDLLVHFGIKGMKWGVRQNRSSSGSSSNKGMSTKKKIAVGVTVAAGAATTAYLLSNRGRTSIASAISRYQANRENARQISLKDRRTSDNYMRDLKARTPFAQQIGQYGRGSAPVRNQAHREETLDRVMNTKVKDISQSEWRRRVESVRGDIRNANADQDRWMRRQGLGRELQAAKLGDIQRNLNDPNYVWEI